MKNRIEEKFLFLRRNKRKAFIAFLTAGYPDLAKTEELVLSFDKAGVDIIELGIPFSDPMADGPTIQNASFQALKKNVTLKKVLQLVKRIRKKSHIPIALMTYYNPVFYYGEESFVNEASAAGVDGLIVPDLPPEEAKGFICAARDKKFSTVFFVSPTTTKERMPAIVEAATGFIYYVSVAGVTGARQILPQQIRKHLREVKKITSKPVCVGFGVSTPQQVRDMCCFADGVIVGSAIIKQIGKYHGRPDMVPNVTKFVKSLIKGKEL